MDRLEQGGEVQGRVEVRAGRDADGAGAGGPRSLRMSPEEVAGDDDIEEVRSLHEMGR